MDLRWDWLRDRVAQNLFVLPYIRSLQNPADFFTKALPVHRHRELAPLFVHYPTPPPHPCSLSLSMHVCIALILHSTVEPMYAFRYYHAYVSIE